MVDVRGFVDMLRDEVGIPDLDLRFNPKAPLWDPPGWYGCWQVIRPVPEFRVVDMGGLKIAHSVIMQKVVYTLNGNHGCPLVPGRWLIHAMAEKDMQRHGRDANHRNVNDRLEHYERQRHRGVDELARDLATNREVRNGFRALAQKNGVRSLTREEILAMEKDAAARDAQLEEKRLRDRKEARIYGHS